MDRVWKTWSKMKGRYMFSPLSGFIFFYSPNSCWCFFFFSLIHYYSLLEKLFWVGEHISPSLSSSTPAMHQQFFCDWKKWGMCETMHCKLIMVLKAMHSFPLNIHPNIFPTRLDFPVKRSSHQSVREAVHTMDRSPVHRRDTNKTNNHSVSHGHNLKLQIKLACMLLWGRNIYLKKTHSCRRRTGNQKGLRLGGCDRLTEKWQLRTFL